MLGNGSPLEGATMSINLEYLYIESSDNLWFERHFVSQTFHYYVTFLFMRGENVGLLNRKNLTYGKIFGGGIPKNVSFFSNFIKKIDGSRHNESEGF